MTAYLNARKLLSGMESWGSVAGSERLHARCSLLERGHILRDAFIQTLLQCPNVCILGKPVTLNESHWFKCLLHPRVKGYWNPSRHRCQDTNPPVRKSETQSTAFARTTKTEGVLVGAEIYSRKLKYNGAKIRRNLVWKVEKEEVGGDLKGI